MSQSSPSSLSLRKVLPALIACVLVGTGAWLFLDTPLLQRAGLVAGITLVLWLTEVVPPFTTTLLLVGAIPLLLGDVYGLGEVMSWAADPVLALFLGGFALSVAATRYGIDATVAGLVVTWSGGRRTRLVALVALGTAVLSMWMSNIAAAAMMIAALRPLFVGTHKDAPFRKVTLLAVAMGANFGGMATPIGTGPNGIAIAAVASSHPITFIKWMVFGIPLTLGMVALAVFILIRLHPVQGELASHHLPEHQVVPGAGKVVALFCLSVLAWLTEPLHHTPAAVVAVLSTATLFGTGLLDKDDLARIDWSSLLLIAGGVTLGRLLEASHLVNLFTGGLAGTSQFPTLQLFGICLLCAMLSALMSNTATAVILMPIVLSLDPSPSMAVLVAISSSFGVAFTISTPPNIMAYGEGGLKGRDILIPGLIMMVVGCGLVTLTGPWVLGLLGLP